MRRLHCRTAPSSTGIDISPLMDMALLLLIFFLVTASFVEEGALGIERPRAAAVSELAKDACTVVVARDGTVNYRGRDVALDDLRPLVAGLMRREVRPVVIVADRSVSSGRLVDVMDEIAAGGAPKIDLATEREEEAAP